MTVNHKRADERAADEVVVAQGVDDEPLPSNQRHLTGWQYWAFAIAAVLYTGFHLYSLNVSPLETWTFRIVHVAGALVLGFGLTAAWPFVEAKGGGRLPSRLNSVISVVAGLAILIAAIPIFGGLSFDVSGFTLERGNLGIRFVKEAIQPTDGIWLWAMPLLTAGTALAIVAGWASHGKRTTVLWTDWVLMTAAVVVCAYLLLILDRHRFTNGTSFAPMADVYVSVAGMLLIVELTRRVAGLALIIIAAVFVGYAFVGPLMPGFLSHEGFSLTQTATYLYSDKGILGPTTAVSSTYIILFIIFAAFLQASKVGDYFVNFAFAAAGRQRGGPAKVAVFASGLMGMINGTSAGNVVATGSLTIPLMKKVGYRSQSAGAIEAAASTGGQIMPPIMGAGAFIMAEITGIPYTELVIAAIIPAILYFASIYFMVDFEAAKTGMRGLRSDELPKMLRLLRQAYLFLPILILVGALFMGYSVIRAGTLATAAAAMISWLTPFRMGPKAILKALKLGAEMSIQIIAVCAAAGLIVGVIALTGVGARFSSLLLGIATADAVPDQVGVLLAMLFAMVIAIILGMGMPTTAAYAVAASVVAPGLSQILEPSLVTAGFADPDRMSRLIAHFFVFYFAVISAITPPVALAAYAGAGIAGADPMRTSVTSFKVGLAAFIVPFMFFYSPAMLMEGSILQVLHVAVSATIGVVMLSAAVQAYFFGPIGNVSRLALLVGALFMIAGGWITDVMGIALAAATYAVVRRRVASTADHVQ